MKESDVEKKKKRWTVSDQLFNYLSGLHADLSFYEVENLGIHEDLLKLEKKHPMVAKP